MNPRDTFLLILGLLPAVTFLLGRLQVLPIRFSLGTGIALLLAILTVLGAVVLVVQYPSQPRQALPRWVQISYLALGLILSLGALLFS